MLETPRLKIIPLELCQLELLLAGTPQMEAALGLAASGNELDEHTREAMAYLYDLALKTPAAFPWITNWQIVLKDRNVAVGSLCFLNVPDAAGEVEVGYGIHPEFRGRGLMTEALQCVADWALAQPAVKRVLAESEPENAASHRVLDKSGFRPVSATHWQRSRNDA